MDQSQIEAALKTLPFVEGFGITVEAVETGSVTVIMPFQERLSAMPNIFPAALVGAIGDVAAICSCLSRQQVGMGVATLDYTCKITNPPKGQFLRARGEVLHSGKSLATAQATIWVIDGENSTHCGVILVSGRNFKIG